MTGGNATILGGMTANNLVAHTFEVTGSLTSANLTGNLVIDFTGASSVSVPTPSVATEAANKSYVDATLVAASSALQADVDRNESDADAAIVAEATTARAAEQANATAISALQSDVDQNESDADAAIAALQAVDASSARQFVVDFGFTYWVNLNAYIGIDLYNPGDDSVYSCEVGDSVLLTGQSNSSENGIYEITNVIGSGTYRSVSLVRSTNYDTAEELNEGDLVLIEKGESNGLAFMLGAISETFVLGNDALTWYRCGINTNQDIDFAGTVSAQGLQVSTAGGYIIFDGMDNRISSSHDTRFEGDRVSFNNYGGVDFNTDVEFVSTVTVQTPTQDNEVANKDYVDGVVVPTGGLIAWPSADVIPNGWSNAMLSSPMNNYIWIRKD